MQSIVKANGDVIKQFELEALLGAERALKALTLHVCRRLAAGARIQRGRLGLIVGAFELGQVASGFHFPVALFAFGTIPPFAALFLLSRHLGGRENFEVTVAGTLGTAHVSFGVRQVNILSMGFRSRMPSYGPGSPRKRSASSDSRRAWRGKTSRFSNA